MREIGNSDNDRGVEVGPMGAWILFHWEMSFEISHLAMKGILQPLLI
jgi:hypothetical protein